MNLDDFIGIAPCEDPSSSLATTGGDSLAPPPRGEVATGVPGVDQPEGSSDAVVPQAPPAEPQFVTSVTPSGLEVLYQWAPTRLYKVRQSLAQGDGRQQADYEASGRKPVEDPPPHSAAADAEAISAGEGHLDWIEVPSVTTVLGVLDKPALPWWGMTIGVRGVLELVERGLIVNAVYDDGAKRLSVTSGLGGLVPADADSVIPLLTQNKLTVNHVRDQAGDRGQSVHDAFEAWAEKGIVPQIDIYAAHERGYVEGLLGFLRDSLLEAEATEIMVGSLEHGFAGRYDLRGSLPKSVDLVVHRTPVKGAQYETFEAGKYLWDLKTSKDFYESHFMQLEAYELASVECGYEPTDARAVVVVAPDGSYKVERSVATADDFLAVKGAQAALESLKGRRKAHAKSRSKKAKETAA